jgi:hypothetical protein
MCYLDSQWIDHKGNKLVLMNPAENEVEAAPTPEGETEVKR